MRAFKMGRWDGNIRLFNFKNRSLYKGLVHYIEAFCKDRGYEFIDESGSEEDAISLVEIEEFFKELNLPPNVQPRDYQIEGVAHCIRRKRCVLISPTASGKSLMIYALLRWYGLRTLVIVPTTTLVHQLYDDFKDYSKTNGWDVDANCSKIMGGYSKENLKDVTFSTWQSVYELPQDWFDKFDMVLVDEAHGAKAKSLVGIMEKLTTCDYRFGTTGTLDDVQVHRFVLEGLFGKVNKIVDTKTLIDNNYLSEIKIKCLLLQYSPESRKALKRDYQEEIDFLISHTKRNNFIANLALSLKDHVLVLYRRVEGHGKILYDTIKERAPDGTKVFFVSGATDAEDRNEIRKIVDSEKGKCIVVASLGTFSTGINIVNIHNIIFASPTKSKITNLQSIGRGLRKGEDKTKFTLFDIADDLSKSGGNKNYTLLHFAERLRIYNEERFPYSVHTIKLEQ